MNLRTEIDRFGLSVRVGAASGNFPRLQPSSFAEAYLKLYLTQCIDFFFIESQLPHKGVNLLFQLVVVKIELPILEESWQSQTLQSIHSVR